MNEVTCFLKSVWLITNSWTRNTMVIDALRNYFAMRFCYLAFHRAVQFKHLAVNCLKVQVKQNKLMYLISESYCITSISFCSTNWTHSNIRVTVRPELTATKNCLKLYVLATWFLMTHNLQDPLNHWDPTVRGSQLTLVKHL